MTDSHVDSIFSFSPGSIWKWSDNGDIDMNEQVLSLSLLVIEGDLDIFNDSAFPVLRKLYLSECTDLRHVKVNCSALEEMTLEKCFVLNTLEVAGSRLERLRVASCFHSLSGKSSVKVDAPRLWAVEWEQNHLTADCSLQNLTALHQASLLFLYGLTKLHEAVPTIKLRAAWNFLHGLSHVQCLKVDTLCMKVGSSFNLLFPTLWSTGEYKFCSLQRLVSMGV